MFKVNNKDTRTIVNLEHGIAGWVWVKSGQVNN